MIPLKAWNIIQPKKPQQHTNRNISMSSCVRQYSTALSHSLVIACFPQEPACTHIGCPLTVLLDAPIHHTDNLSGILVQPHVKVKHSLTNANAIPLLLHPS